jgi:hypothetical protein
MAAIPAAKSITTFMVSSRRRGLAKRDIGIRLCNVYGNTVIYPGKQRALVLHRCATLAQRPRKAELWVVTRCSLPRGNQPEMRHLLRRC